MLLNLLVKPVWLVLENKVQNQIGHAAYGTFGALFAFTFIFTAFTDLGIYHYVTKKIAATPAFMAAHFPVILPFKTLLAVVFPFFILLTGWFIGYQGVELYYLIFIGFMFTFTQYIQFLRGVWQAHQRFNLDSVLSVMERFILIFIVVALLYLGITLDTYIYARFASVLLTFAVLYGLFRRHFGRFSLQWNWAQLRLILKASLPFAIINLVYGINEKIDMVMLERLASSREAGIYAGAYRWVDAVMMYLWTILPIFFAKFAANLQEQREQQKLLRFGQVIISVPLIYGSIFVFFYGEKLFWQFTYSSAAELDLLRLNLQILFANVLVQGLFAIYSTVLTASNWELTVSKLVALSIVINVTLNYLFIPQYGSVASSVNTLISALVIAGGNLWLLRPKLGLKVPVNLLLKLALSGLLLAAIFYGLQLISGNWWFNSGLAGLLFLGLLFGLRILRWADLKSGFAPKLQ